jgi:hypothetical protein
MWAVAEVVGPLEKGGSWVAITDRTRKRLWAASGGRCAKCRCRLVHRGSQPDGDAVVGDECDIAGRMSTSARAGEPIPGGDIDGNDNLILLCASDHRLIDSQPGSFPTATVCELKRAHERWVEQSLEVSVRAQSETVQLRLTHAHTGKGLLDAVAGCDALQFGYCEPRGATEEEAIAELADELHDCDIVSELGGAERVRAASRMSELLWRLGEHGMLAWWGHLTRQWPTPTGPMPYRLAVVEVRRMAQDQELIAAHLQDIHDELRRRGWSTERIEALLNDADVHPTRDGADKLGDAGRPRAEHDPARQQ